MKRISSEEAIEMGLTIHGASNDASAVTMEIEAVLVDCGFTLGSEMANGVLNKVLTNLKRNQAPLIPILPGSKIAEKNPGCEQWNFENAQAVQPSKIYKASAPVDADNVKPTKAQLAAEKANDKAIIKAAKEAAVTVTENKSNKKEANTMAKSREEKKNDSLVKVAANNNTNKEDVTMNKNVAEVKGVVAEGLAALKGLASDYGVTADDVKTATQAAGVIAPVTPVAGGLKKLRVGAGKTSFTRNPFWYRDYEGVDLSKGELVEYENAGNLRYIVTMDEPMYDVSRVLFFATHSTNANALCDVMVELDNGLLLKGFKIWKSKENDGSISLLSPRYSYTKKDTAKGTDELAYGSHVEFRDKEGKMTASGFVATILACADCIFSDGTASEDDDEE
jgi:hypothetical protein